MATIRKLRREFAAVLRNPEVKQAIKKISFIERVHLDELASILNGVHDSTESVEEWESKQIDKLHVLIERVGGREVINKKMLSYGINLDAIMIASGIF